jgi:hypothetical protein
MVVFVIGPSRAGKTAVTKRLQSLCPDFSDRSFKRIDLDEVLGPSDRGHASKAIEVCNRIIVQDQPGSLILIDVGAGQLVEREFQDFLKSIGACPTRVIVIDCGEETFRERHGKYAPNEVIRYYGQGSLAFLWEEARARHLCIDSSARFSLEESTEQLRTVLKRLLEPI